VNVRRRFDVDGFISSFRTYDISAVKDMIIRRILTKIMGSLYNRNMPYWLDLVKGLISNENFLLIILDACRYDFFMKLAPKFFKGEVQVAISEGAFLPNWIPLLLKSLCKYGSTRIYRATSSWKPHNLKLMDFLVKGEDCLELVELEPNELKFLGVVSPWEVNAIVETEGLTKRTVVWYMQPHFPWLRYPNMSLKLLPEVIVYEFVPATLVKKRINKKGINRNMLTKFYVSNLLLVLEATRALLNTLNERYKIFDEYKIVITSDHGELLGEYGLFFHSPGYKLPQLIKIPWMDVYGIQ